MDFRLYLKEDFEGHFEGHFKVSRLGGVLRGPLRWTWAQTIWQRQMRSLINKALRKVQAKWVKVKVRIHSCYQWLPKEHNNTPQIPKGPRLS